MTYKKDDEYNVDYSTLLRSQMDSGASWQDVEANYQNRLAKIAGDPNLAKYANDDIMKEAYNYIMAGKNAQAPTEPTPPAATVTGTDWQTYMATNPMPETFDPQAYMNANPAPEVFDPQAYMNANPIPEAFDPQVYINANPTPEAFDPQAYINAYKPEAFDPQAYINANPMPETFDPQAYINAYMPEAFDPQAYMNANPMPETFDPQAYMNANPMPEAFDPQAYMNTYMPETFDPQAYLEANPLGTWDSEAYNAANPLPTYDDSYKTSSAEQLDKLLNWKEFSYDPNTDPVYQSYASTYAREGDRAMRDALASAAIGAGGMNTYALSAAQQANNYYMAQLGDKIPELYQMAYDMYLQDRANAVENLGLTRDMDNTNWNRYMDETNIWNNNRNFDYGVMRDNNNEQLNVMGLLQNASNANMSNFFTQMGFAQDAANTNMNNYYTQMGFAQDAANTNLNNYYTQMGFAQDAANANMNNFFTQMGFAQDAANTNLNNYYTQMGFAQDAANTNMNNFFTQMGFAQDAANANMNNYYTQMGFAQDAANANRNDYYTQMGFAQDAANANRNDYYTQMGLAQDAANTNLDNWYKNGQLLNSDYWDSKNFEQGQKEWEYKTQQDAIANADADQKNAYSTVWDLISMGITPEDALLEAAGLLGYKDALLGLITPQSTGGYYTPNSEPKPEPDPKPSKTLNVPGYGTITYEEAEALEKDGALKLVGFKNKVPVYEEVRKPQQNIPVRK